jgi:glycosyltransferase involved in cell wall biosynthesis
VALLAHRESGVFSRRLRDAGVKVWEIAAGLRGYASELRFVAEVLRETRADVLHTHVYRADTIGYLAARRVGIPVVATVHGFTGGDWKNQAYQWIDRQLLRRMDAVSAVSPALLEELRRIGARSDSLRHIPNAVPASGIATRDEARHELGIPRDGVVVGWVGRMSAEKAPLRFVEAIVRTSRPVHGAIIGDGPLLAEVRAAAKASQGRVSVLGPREGAGRLLAAFDALALTSDSEGTPMVLLEAMRAEVPIVSFAVGGVPALLGDAGTLVPPGDVAALASAFGDVLTDPEGTRARAARARHRVDSAFGESEWVRAHTELYRLAMR